MIEVYTECIVGLTHHAEHSSIRIHIRTHTACACISRSEPYGMCFEAFCCRFFDTGIHFNVIWFIMFSLGRAYGQSSLKLTIIHLKPNKHTNASAYVHVHQKSVETKALHQVRNNQVYSILDMLHMQAFLSLFWSMFHCSQLLQTYMLYSL